MSELTIRNGEPIDIVADASLDGTGIEGNWLDDEFHVVFRRGGKVIAGFSLGEEGINQLFILLKVAINDRRK